MTGFTIYVAFMFSMIICVLSIDILDSNNKFANNLYAILARENENSFFSPLSAHIVLTMAYRGATNKTALALQTILNLPTPEVAGNEYKNVLTELNTIKDVKLHIASNMYVQEGYKLKSNFELSMTNLFEAQIQKTNFNKSTEAAYQINKWVETQTNNKIKNIISSDDINEDTQLVLVNAIYFKGFWLYPFNEENTRTEKFYTSETNSVNCQMMHITKKYMYAKRADLNAKILKMPYVNKHTNLIIILPNSRTGIKQLEKQIAYRDFNSIIQGLTEAEVKVSLPKFKIETSMDLTEPLIEMGLANIFSDSAEFGNMFESSMPLQISKIIQKAFIEIDEKGSEASAATGLEIMMRSMPIPRLQISVVVDHPFIIILTYERNQELYPIFMGRIMQPL